MISALRLVSRQSVKLNVINGNIIRLLSTTNPLQLKEIRVKQEANTLQIEGVYVEHPRAKYQLKADTTNTTSCHVCALGLDIKHTDVLILSQFVRPDGCMLPRRVTGLCRMQQKRIGTMITMAQKAGLMPNLAPLNSKKDPEKRSKWKKFNTYFDETTIGQRRKTLPKYF